MSLLACVFIYFINFFPKKAFAGQWGKETGEVALHNAAEILFCFTDPDLEEEELFKDA